VVEPSSAIGTEGGYEHGLERRGDEHRARKSERRPKAPLP